MRIAITVQRAHTFRLASLLPILLAFLSLPSASRKVCLGGYTSGDVCELAGHFWIYLLSSYLNRKTASKISGYVRINSCWEGRWIVAPGSQQLILLKLF